jgi:putative methionine-R-sulfoxide reductase with GAF domain
MTDHQEFSWQGLALQADGLLGVLDIDSTRLARFSEQDELGLAKLVKVYLASVI